jgi:hypothetical protein
MIEWKDGRPVNWTNIAKEMVRINRGDTRRYFKYGAEQYEKGATNILTTVIKEVDDIFQLVPDCWLQTGCGSESCTCEYQQWQLLKKDME